MKTSIAEPAAVGTDVPVVSAHHEASPEQRIFSLALPPVVGQPLSMWRKLYNRSVPSLERMLGLSRINEIYAAASDQTTHAAFCASCLQEMQITCHISADDLARIPKTGPVVVVSNHPFGAIDGLMLGWALKQVRPDVKIMANYILQRIPQLRDMFIFVDPFGGETAKTANIRPMRESLRHLKDGGLLAAFPAGEVAHLNLRERQVTDPPWNPTIARIIQRSGAAVLPVYFDGHNGALFQLLGLVHPRLRTAMLARALIHKQGNRIEMRIGKLISPRKVQEFETEDELLTYFRSRTFLLRHRPKAPIGGAGRSTPPAARVATHQAAMEPIIPPVDSALISRDIARLSPAQLLVEHDEMAVYQAMAPQMPNVLRELGRLREVTFRGTGEGSGRSIDLDSFDLDYVHVFIWNRVKQELVGAYRLGATDTIIPRKGPEGLYTSTLFDYKQELLEQLGPALEMGRSFVRAEYQRSFAPLLLLWKGIGRYILNNPRYRMLFGPVSISNDYQGVSRHLMVQFLRVHHLLSDLSPLVRPRNPFRAPRLIGLDEQSVAAMARQSDDLSELVADIEPDQKGIPILLKHYLKLGAKLLSVNVDNEFSDVVDGLIVVDLLQTEPKILEKYMSKDGRASFVAYHALHQPRKSRLQPV